MADEHAPLTAEEIEAIRARHNKASAQYKGMPVHEDMARLLATLDAYREVARAVAAGPLATTHGDLACVFCERWIGPGQSHAPDCPVTVARALLGDTP